MNRSIYYLRQFLKSKEGKLSSSQEDKTQQVKIQKQRFLVDRNRLLESALTLVKQLNKRAFLEIQYRDEAGVGLGPTLEFYNLIAQEVKAYQGATGAIWRKQMQDNSLFPAPINMLKVKEEELKKIYEMFRMTGMMVAKSISDDRLIDLPLSSVFWDLVLGKVI